MLCEQWAPATGHHKKPPAARTSSVSPGTLLRTEWIQASVAGAPTRAACEQLQGLFSRDTFTIIASHLFPSVTRTYFTAATPEDAATLRLLFSMRSDPSLFGTMFPALRVPSCWRRVITPRIDRGIQFSLRASQQAASGTLGPTPEYDAVSRIWPLSTKERELCNAVSMSASSFVALRDALVRDPFCKWFTLLDVASRMPLPFGGFDMAAAMIVARHFCEVGDAVSVAFVEVLPSP